MQRLVLCLQEARHQALPSQGVSAIPVSDKTVPLSIAKQATDTASTPKPTVNGDPSFTSVTQEDMRSRLFITAGAIDPWFEGSAYLLDGGKLYAKKEAYMHEMLDSPQAKAHFTKDADEYIAKQINTKNSELNQALRAYPNIAGLNIEETREYGKLRGTFEHFQEVVNRVLNVAKEIR